MSIRWRDRTGEARSSGLMADAGTTEPTVLVDLDEIQGRALDVLSSVGSLEPQLVTTITLRPGTQHATVDVTSH